MDRTKRASALVSTAAVLVFGLWAQRSMAQEGGSEPDPQQSPAPAEAEPEPPALEPAVQAPADAAPEAAEPGGVQAPAEAPAEVAPETTTAEQRAFNLKLRGLEERVNELKEKIFQSKARLTQLQEVVVHGTVAGAKAVLVHRNEMGSSFRLRRVQYSLDGAPIFNRVDEQGSELDEAGEIEIFNGSIAPGNHQIAVFLEYQGYGYGVFSYLQGYRFKVKSSHTFTAEEGKLTTVQIIGFEKGGMTTELKDRPAVKFDVESSRAVEAPAKSDKDPAQGATNAP